MWCALIGSSTEPLIIYRYRGLQKHNGRLRELLELQHVVEYLTSCSGEGSPRGRPKSTGGGAGGGGLSWAGLWRSITVYVRKETEAICKLEEKGSGSTSALSNRQTKKKVIVELTPSLPLFNYSITSCIFPNIPHLSHPCNYCHPGRCRDSAGVLQGGQ